MADEPNQPPVEDTAVESPIAGVETPEHTDDYEKRYKDVQAAYTQSQQELAEYRKVYEAAQQGDPDALASFGIEPEPEEYQDPYDHLKSEFDKLREEISSSKQEAEARQQEEQLLDYFDTELSAIEKAENLNFSDDEMLEITVLAGALPNAQGLPDVQAAYKRLLGRATAWNDKVVAQKRAAQQVQSGRAAEKTVDLSNENERINRMAAIMEAHNR